jgi:hypothetical protein
VRDEQTRSGGNAKYLLSGLLRCDVCGAHYILVSGVQYRCSCHKDGGPCSNPVRVRRDQAEDVLLGPIRYELLAPARVQRMAEERARLPRDPTATRGQPLRPR